MWGIVVGVAGMAAVVYAVLGLASPWAYSITFGPTLIGSWVGEFVPPGHRPQSVYVELLYAGADGGDEFYGRALLCDERGDRRGFDLSGSPRNRHGTSFRFTTSVPDNLKGDGVQLGQVDGEWDGADTLRVTSTVLFYQIRDGGLRYTGDGGGATPAKPEAPAVQFSLRRGRERDFDAACGAAGR